MGIPLTIRAQRLTFLPAFYNVTELETALDFSDVVVLMKVSSVDEQVWAVLQGRGLLDLDILGGLEAHPTRSPPFIQTISN